MSGVILNHNDPLAELRLKICQLIRGSLGKSVAVRLSSEYLTLTYAGKVAGAEIEMEYVQLECLLVEAHGIDIVG
jgi:hypothetical protein